jgi:hypothetical protein
MEPHREEPQKAPPPSAEQKPKRFRIVREERFRIVRLEERIAPKKATSGGPGCHSGVSCGSCGSACATCWDPCNPW